MNRNRIILTVAIIGIIIIGGLFAYKESDKNKIESDKISNKSDQMMQKEDKDLEADKMSDKKMMEDNTNVKSYSDNYKEYSVETVKSEQNSKRKVVLFFHAEWCPYCKAADTAFKANSNLIPKDVTVLKTNYDTEKELKKKYGVTYQHTFVQIDDNGNKITSWVSGDVDMLNKNIK